ncbi:ABC transporter substrate-binding protein [Pelagibacterium lacus]|uniref:ABC transporter substrate-binding protein n=1 Tax=Pelagibacterium lacus TaxID=2282655 RepID=A0A369W3B6_9HYPH|nr:ABC transporter substrate-binding protein [Pelagibacterium lacus]RDE09028.1 ABC transporter substrate-binding protein [Pelagibacterium lacus]
MTFSRLSLAAAATLLAAPAMAQSIDSCNELSFSYDAPPSRAISVFQQATEYMLALGLEDRLIATAYLEDEIPAQWRAAYDSIDTHYEEVPAREVVLATNADFLLSGFVSAFRDEQLGSQQEWHDLGVGTYLVNSECRTIYDGTEPMTTDPIFVDIERLGALFGVEERAGEVAADIRARLDAIRDDNAGEGLTAFLFDSGTDTPYSAGCCGSPALLLASVGLTNIAADVEGRWAELAWEAVVVADPDVIVINDAVWSTAQEKIDYMEADPVLSQLRAVKDQNYVSVPFSETILGMRFVDGVERLSAGLDALDLD